MFGRNIVALVTPMTKNQAIDYPKVAVLIERQISSGTDAIVIAGTTGESGSLTEHEKKDLLKVAIQTSEKRIPIIAGIGAITPSQAIQQAIIAESLGAHGLLVVTPYYLRATQSGLINYYLSIARAVQLPIILYNVPHRTGNDLMPSSVATLSHISNIIGLKDASGKLDRVNYYTEKCKENFLLYSGDDGSALEFMELGGYGVISVATNVVPRIMQHLCNTVAQDNLIAARQINALLIPLFTALSLEPNPIPIKWALYYLKLIEDIIRPPLTSLSPQHQDAIIQALSQLNQLSIGNEILLTLSET